jgi:hypothetical protein
MRNGMIAIVLLCFLSARALACEYYAYVDYGPAVKDGYLNETENAYHSSGVLKLKKGFKATYSEFGETSDVSGFHIKNLGPFENEAVATKALVDFIDQLEARGFVEKTSRHSFPEVILENMQECDD